MSIMQAAATSPKKLKFSEEELPKTPPKGLKKNEYGMLFIDLAIFATANIV